MSKIEPLGDRVAVKVIPTKKETAGGIALTDNAEGYSATGEVIAVGPERYFGNTAVPLNVRVGQRVIFHHKAGFKVTDDDGQEILILKEEDIQAVINQ